MRRSIACLILLCSASIGLIAVAPIPIRFEQFSIERGLSQSIVECIVQDPAGFIWLGTEDGLNRFDGYSFAVFRPTPGLPGGISHNHVVSLCVDRSGALWIGTFNGGLNRYDLKTGRFTTWIYRPVRQNYNRIDPRTGLITSQQSVTPDPTSISHNLVRSIAEGHDGTLWVGTEGGGLNRFDRATGRFTVYRHDPINPTSLSDDAVTALREDSSGALWVGTRSGLNRFDPRTGRSTVFRHDPAIPTSLAHDNINALVMDRQGRLWVGTHGGGLDRLDPAGGVFVHYRNDPRRPATISSDLVNAVLEDSVGRLWVGTTGGLDLLDATTDTFAHYRHEPSNPHSLSIDEVRSLGEDSGGVLWAGTYGGGLNKWDGRPKSFTLYRPEPGNSNSLSVAIIWTLHEDRTGALWIGTHGGGLDRFDRQTGRWSHYRPNAGRTDGLSSDRIRVVCEDRQGYFWIGTHNGGLDYFDPATGRCRVFRHDPADPASLSHDEIRTVIADRDGIVWIGTFGGGLNRLDPQTGRFTRYRFDARDPASLGNDVVRVVFSDRAGRLWAGTHGGGLNLLDKATGRFTRYRSDPANPKSLSSDFILAIHEDKAGALWLGTWGGGLNRFNPATGVDAVFTTADGLPSNSIYGILEDDHGRLWISTNNGLCCFDPRTRSFRNYTEEDGLQSNEFNGGAFHRGRSGVMFFGGLNGFNAFRPDAIRDNPHVPPVVLTGFRKLNQPVDVGAPLHQVRELVLSPRDYLISLEFAALDFTISEKNRYAYRLDKFDPDWIITDASKRFATYTALPPGTYTFHVRGSNNDGVWNNAGASIQIVIPPPFWLTWWAKALAALVVVVGLWLLHQGRTRWLRRQLEQDRLEREMRLKADFTAMMIHDLRNPLTAVMGYAELLRLGAAATEAAEAGDVIARSSERMLELINNMLDLSKFEAGKMTIQRQPFRLSEAVDEAAALLVPLFEQKRVRLVQKVDPGLVEAVLDADPYRIGQVINNLLSNALKFSPAGGVVTLTTQRANNGVEVAVSDEGPGIPKEKAGLLFDKYSQLHSTTGSKGTGLGLAVSKLIVEAHGGSIGHRPVQDGQGSIFFFWLPIS